MSSNDLVTHQAHSPPMSNRVKGFYINPCNGCVVILPSPYCWSKQLSNTKWSRLKNKWKILNNLSIMRNFHFELHSMLLDVPFVNWKWKTTKGAFFWNSTFSYAMVHISKVILWSSYLVKLIFCIQLKHNNVAHFHHFIQVADKTFFVWEKQRREEASRITNILSNYTKNLLCFKKEIFFLKFKDFISVLSGPLYI